MAERRKPQHIGTKRDAALPGSASSTAPLWGACNVTRGQSVANLRLYTALGTARKPWSWTSASRSGISPVNPGPNSRCKGTTHRAEHWVAVRSAAAATNGDVVRLLLKASPLPPWAQCTGSKPLAYPHGAHLALIRKLQSGAYLGVDASSFLHVVTRAKTSAAPG